MAKAGKTHMGAAPQSQGSGGGGAGTVIDKDKIGENMVLSNRDKAQHPPERGLDSKAIESDQYQDQSANHERD